MSCWIYYKHEGKKFFIRNKPIFCVCMEFQNIQIIVVPITRIIIHNQAIHEIFSIEAIMIYCLIMNYNIKKRLKKYHHIGRKHFHFQVYRCYVDTCLYSHVFYPLNETKLQPPFPGSVVMAPVRRHTVVQGLHGGSWIQLKVFSWLFPVLFYYGLFSFY